ncbi:MAG: 4Fe-4S ferredoxin [Candidatus Methanomethylicia archaeon]|nr:4Fe-4S ferredoxin [Candidatus Methanomethylicia archaeon]
MEFKDLMEVNVASKEIRNKKKILLVGTCLINEYPKIIEKYIEGKVKLNICLEREHFNMACLKLASIIARVPLEEVIILTVDGSPHCIQLHFMMDEIEKITGKKLNRRHIVVYKGKDIEVNVENVKKARYLTKIVNEENANTSISS